MEQRHSSANLAKISDNVLQEGRSFTQDGSAGHNHNQGGQKRKAATVDQDFRNKTQMDRLFTMAMGKTSWPNSGRFDGTSHGSQHSERCSFKLLSCDSKTAHKPPSSRFASGEKEVSSGTTGQVALELGRKCIGIELNPKYVELALQRCHITPGLAL